jgi:hypothetical protein
LIGLLGVALLTFGIVRLYSPIRARVLALLLVGVVGLVLTVLAWRKAPMSGADSQRMRRRWIAVVVAGFPLLALCRLSAAGDGHVTDAWALGVGVVLLEYASAAP